MVRPSAILLAVCLLFSAILRAQEPGRFGSLQVVQYGYGEGYFHYILPCKQANATLEPALCWVVRVAQLHEVDGKAQADAFEIGNLIISANRVYFRPESAKAALTIDVSPASVTLSHAPGKSFAVLTANGNNYVIVFLLICPTCSQGAAYDPPKSNPEFDTEFSDLSESMKHFDAVSKRINDLATAVRFAILPANQPSIQDQRNIPMVMHLYSAMNHQLVSLCSAPGNACIQSFEKYQACRDALPNPTNEQTSAGGSPSTASEDPCGVAPTCSATCTLPSEVLRSLQATVCQSKVKDYNTLVPDWTPVAEKMEQARNSKAPVTIKMTPVVSSDHPRVGYMGLPLSADGACSVSDSYQLAMMSHDANTGLAKMRTEGRSNQPELLVRVPPTYPAVAKAAHVSGIVVLNAVISKEGDIASLEVVSGPDLLRTAALTAVRQWKYKPFLLNGTPVPVKTVINVDFALPGSPTTVLFKPTPPTSNIQP